MLTDIEIKKVKADGKRRCKFRGFLVDAWPARNNGRSCLVCLLAEVSP